MNLRISTLVVAALASMLAACEPPLVQKVGYVPQPQRVAKPRESLPTLIALTTPPACASEQGFVTGAFIVKLVCTLRTGTIVLRLDRVESLGIEHREDFYFVRVHHRGGLDDFLWACRSLDDAEGLADAITALAQPPATTAVSPAL